MSQPIFRPQEYVRRPLVVLAEEVTEENMQAVADWCKGEIRTSAPSKKDGRQSTQRYIKVPVKRALNQKQTQAYPGDWVLEAGSGFKVYTGKAFVGSFQKKVKEMLDTVERMMAREETEEAEETAQADGKREDVLPSGGINASFVSP